MSVNLNYIENRLRSFWPNSNKLTPELLAEIERGCEDWQSSHFDDALFQYREKSAKYQFPPLWRDLRPYGPKSAGNNALSWSLFANNVTYLGWAEALRVAFHGNSGHDFPQGEKIRQLLSRAGISEFTPAYGNGVFPDHLEQFWHLLHVAQEPAVAFAHLADVTKSARTRRQAEFFKGMDSEYQRHYFPCLRVQGELAGVSQR